MILKSVKLKPINIDFPIITLGQFDELISHFPMKIKMTIHLNLRHKLMRSISSIKHTLEDYYGSKIS